MGDLQGLVVGPVLWNIFHEEMLGIEMPGGCKLVADAEDSTLWRGGHEEDLPTSGRQPVKE